MRVYVCVACGEMCNLKLVLSPQAELSLLLSSECLCPQDAPTGIFLLSLRAIYGAEQVFITSVRDQLSLPGHCP